MARILFDTHLLFYYGQNYYNEYLHEVKISSIKISNLQKNLSKVFDDTNSIFIYGHYIIDYFIIMIIETDLHFEEGISTPSLTPDYPNEMGKRSTMSGYAMLNLPAVNAFNKINRK